jgi:hypothetical protein
MAQPKKDPYLPESKQPMMECQTCDNWKEKRNAEGAIDYAAGSCPATGLTHCPARHVCELWKMRVRRKGGAE